MRGRVGRPLPALAALAAALAAAPAAAAPAPDDAGVLAGLKAVRRVSAANKGAVTGLLYDASESLRARWDPALVREAARVVDLSMGHDRRDFELVASPFRPQLLGPRRGEFLDLLLPVLDGVHREAFLRFVRVLERVEREGNG